MTMGEPELVYSSNEHGISLTTFYHRSEQYEPTILVIKTTEGEVFGAYCSTSWVSFMCLSCLLTGFLNRVLNEIFLYPVGQPIWVTQLGNPGRKTCWATHFWNPVG